MAMSVSEIRTTLLENQRTRGEAGEEEATLSASLSATSAVSVAPFVEGVAGVAGVEGVAGVAGVAGVEGVAASEA